VRSIAQSRHLSKSAQHAFQANRQRGKRARGQDNLRLPYAPPENWYEPTDTARPYRFVYQPAGEGYRHVLTPEDVRQRLAALPEQWLADLQVVQFSRMTHKKSRSPCYGMQWGSTIYLYPIESDLIEHHHQPPVPSQITETRMYGGRWEQESPTLWKLIWTEEAIRDFYLNNILIHELGHLLDSRNGRSIDRERYAEWFAIEYGYRPTRRRA
jgi:hypothetical protein